MNAHPSQPASLPIPTSLAEITASWLTRALAAGGVLPGATVTRYTPESIAEGKGFTNRVFRLHLEYQRPNPGLPASLLVKLPATDPLMLPLFRLLGPNLREVNFYRNLSRDCALQTPVCYFGQADPATGNSALLLEDLGSARQGDSVAGCSLDEARQIARRLAAFHAQWWDSPLLDGLVWLPPRDDEALAYQELHEPSWRSLTEKTGRLLPPGLRQLGDSMPDLFGRVKSMLAESPRTIVHGDFRLDNFYYPADAASPAPLVLDWEYCGIGRGVFDLATFVCEAFPPAQRRREEWGLLTEYHSALTASGITGYSLNQCWNDYRLSLLDVFALWIVGGAFCDYSGERATTFLSNTLQRLDAAISDLRPLSLL
ncbi:MAG: phosphotransferase [Chloroflexi bacterium]|nr:phosphotransferase [Chloroflexota bacterium]